MKSSKNLLALLGTLIFVINLVTFAGTTVLDYQKILNDREKELRTELMTLVDIKDEHEWTKAKKEVWPAYTSACAHSTRETIANNPLPKKLITPLCSLLNNPEIKRMLAIEKVKVAQNNMNITITRANGPTITITSANSKLQADAATDQFTIMVDPDVLLATHANDAEIKATFAHEIIHIVHEDDLDVYCFDQFCKRHKRAARKARKKLRTIKGKWERIQEKRADILSGLVDIEYARANRDHFKRNMPDYETLKRTDTHPTAHQRYEYLNELVQNMEQNQKSKTSSAAEGIILTLLLLFSVQFAIRKKRKNA